VTNRKLSLYSAALPPLSRSTSETKNDSGDSPRAVCYVCHKAKVTCVCARIPRVENRTSVLVVQHPRERLHSIGTARFAALGLTKARVEIAWNAGTPEEAAPAWLPEDAALLYPGPAARELKDLNVSERPRHLVVIDGTWHTARTLYRDKAWLRRLPQVSLTPAEPSRYRIRREPEAHCVSTIEAIVQALRVLEPETNGLDALIGAFDGMIDDQLAFIARGSALPRTRDKRPEPWRAVPRALVEDFERLIVTYGESSRKDPRGPRELVQWTAVSLATGRAFERLLRPSFGLPAKGHLCHMGLTEADFLGAVEPERFKQDWQRFLDGEPSVPVVSAWNQTTLDVLATVVGGVASRVSLKSAYRNRRGGGCGSLDDVIAEERLFALAIPVPLPAPFRGRAAVRVARAIAVARLLNARACGRAFAPPPERALVPLPEHAFEPSTARVKEP
jgi:DTW domain-containing protein YfiP